MRPLSAAECISPAIDRTRLILFSPFRPGRTWKFCAISYLCRMGSLYIPFPLFWLPMIPAMGGQNRIFAVTLTASVLFFLALYSWVFHLCSRLQFVYFDMVTSRNQFVRPLWRKSRDKALPFTALKIAVSLAITAILTAPLAAYLPRLMPVLKQMIDAPAGQPPPPQFFPVFYGGYAIIALIVALGMLVSGVLSDFLVPSIALENTRLRDAFHRMTTLIGREPKEFPLYVLLKTALGVVAYIAAIVLWEIAFFLVSIVLGGAIVLLGFLLHLAGVPTIALAVPGILLAVIWYVFTFFYVMAFAIGPVITWMDAYALYFLGGRYPLLGDLLDASTPSLPFEGFNPYIPPEPPPFAPPA